MYVNRGFMFLNNFFFFNTTEDREPTFALCRHGMNKRVGDVK